MLLVKQTMKWHSGGNVNSEKIKATEKNQGGNLDSVMSRAMSFLTTEKKHFH